MSLDSDLRAWLLALTTLDDLIDGRLYSRVAPQAVSVPYVVWLRVSSPGAHHLTGGAEIAQPRYQVSCYGSTHGQAHAVAAAIRDALDGWRGDIGSTRVRWAEVEDVRDSYEDRGDGSEIGLYRTDLDLLIVHEE